MKIAILCDADTRKDTTGVYVKNGFENLGHEVRIFNPTKGVPKGWDVYVMVDDGRQYEVPTSLRPLVLLGDRHSP